MRVSRERDVRMAVGVEVGRDRRRPGGWGIVSMTNVLAPSSRNVTTVPSMPPPEVTRSKVAVGKLEVVGAKRVDAVPIGGRVRR